MEYELVHTCIRVFNLDKSIEFYNKALGLKEAKRVDYPDKRFTLVYMADEISGHEIELTYNYNQREPYELGNGYSHVAFYVDNLQKSYQAHRSAGYSVSEPKGLDGSGLKLYFVKDPDGYTIEIIEQV